MKKEMSEQVTQIGKGIATEKRDIETESEGGLVWEFERTKK